MDGQASIRMLVIAMTLTLATCNANAAAILKSEPPMCQLKQGQRVLVDDGSCGSGQIREVTGGNHTKAGGKDNTIRQYRCVPR